MEKFIHYTKIFAFFYLAGVFLTWVGYQMGKLNEMEKELKRQRKRQSCARVNVDTVLDNGYPNGNNEVVCYVVKWIELLQKVRDGK